MQWERASESCCRICDTEEVATRAALSTIATTRRTVSEFSLFGGKPRQYVPGRTTDEFLVVFFRGADPKLVVSPDDLKWTVQARAGLRYSPIGFGAPTSADRITVYGHLTEGLAEVLSRGRQPLLVLIFVVPKNMPTFTLRSPEDKEQSVVFDPIWQPSQENWVSGLQLLGGGTVTIGPPGPTDAWQFQE